MAKKVTNKKNVSKKPTKSMHKIEKDGNKSIIEQEKPKSDKELRQRYIAQLKAKEKQCPFKIKYTKAGQPTKFEERFAQEMLNHFENHVADGYYEEYVEETLNAFGQPVDQIKKRAKSIPMFEDYALSIGVDSHSLLNWAVYKDKEGKITHKEFFSSYKKCLDIQLRMLKALGMNGSYVSNIVKLLLSAEHGIYDIKEENDHTDKGKKLDTINSMNIDDNLQDVLS